MLLGHVGVKLFQSTLPRRERPDILLYICSLYRDFNPRSHEGSDEVAGGVYGIQDRISIHAPTKGATLFLWQSAIQFNDFNPRSHEGSDVVTADLIALTTVISIHAPTKGATGIVDSP